MAKPRIRRERLTIEVSPDVRQEIVQWAVAEERTISNLLRHVLGELIDQRLAAKLTAVNRPIRKQLTA
jgi:hypothetical protein